MDIQSSYPNSAGFLLSGQIWILLNFICYAELESQLKYLDSLISEGGYCTKEIRSRIEMAKKVFMEIKKLFTGKMNLELKNEMFGLECSTVCSRDVDADTDRQKKIRSL